MKCKFFEWFVLLGFQLIELGCKHVPYYLCFKESYKNGSGWETVMHVIDVQDKTNNNSNK